MNGWMGDACYYGLNICVPLKSVIWNLIPTVMVSGGGASGRCSAHVDVDFDEWD